MTREEYRRYLESLSEAELLDEARRVARADLGRRDMSPQYVACWFVCVDRGLAGPFTRAVYEVRQERQQHDRDNAARLREVGNPTIPEKAP